MNTGSVQAAPYSPLTLGILWLALGVALGLGVGGILGARHLYMSFPEKATALAGKFAFVHNILKNKYWVDEAYEMLIVSPLMAISRGLWRFVPARTGRVSAIAAAASAPPQDWN